MMFVSDIFWELNYLNAILQGKGLFANEICNFEACDILSNNICKATTVTHTKRIDRNLLCKETSFVCYTSSVLRKSRHMKKKKKLRTVAQIKTQDYRN